MKLNISDVANYLLQNIVACPHGEDCTTGCPQAAALQLKAKRISQGIAESILNDWTKNGIPEHLKKTISSENAFIYARTMDIEYKRQVLRIAHEPTDEGKRKKAL